MKKILVICLCIYFVILAGCGSGGNTPSPTAGSAVSAPPSDGPSASANPSSSPVVTSSAPENKKLIFAEDNTTKAIFHIGMTHEQVKQAFIENKLQLNPKPYGNSKDDILLTASVLLTIDGVVVDFNYNNIDLLYMVAINPVSETELYSPYSTQKGLKIGDTLEMLTKLYGEPDKIINANDVVDPDLYYLYFLPISADDYYDRIARMDTKKQWNMGKPYLSVCMSRREGSNFNKIESIVYYA